MTSKRWAWTVLFALLAGLAWGHAEPVQVVVVVTPAGQELKIDVQMVGEVSTLPIRGAVVEARFYVRTPELQQLLDEGGGSVSRAGDPDLLGVPVASVPLEEPKEGGYRGALPAPPPGDYVLAVVDTTFKGEAAVAAKPLRLPLPPTGATLALQLPETTTPNRYLLYALLGLALPALVGIGFALAARGERKAD
ncbi:hypothetical protein [Oceanithermus desulfurans]|uniref:Gram-positive cocci surface proteins LPxTG domain-containing protein n=2 Tax=Oceanithermus desulfurans TaxID=227924 RepID=A0A511RH47_9DEIN|nr:hypothetical protein [Oceanithermus desulfurans]MBB6028903.1 hypothetical protein [Oceanithermus desulfurans]GEM88960.1 hypothetical protein ODE01S_03940 [Oceanithermus desulfurans NBRC 100063]